ncbi:MAG: xylulose kinase [Candidatus Hydrogenedens sp.]|nr:xylulose kinase [Candidatus Hydrogenedens sp.]
MPNEACVLAVDLGTSGCKTALVTLDGRVLAWRFQAVETLLFPNGGAEQRPQDWWDALTNTTRALLAEGGVPAESIRAVCCSTQGEGTVPVDREGAALANCILWMDSRGAPYLHRHTRGLINVEGYSLPRLIQWLRLTGGAPSATGKDPASHMLYVRDAMPEVYAKTHKFLNVLDYLNLRLTGRFVATYDSILTSWVTDNRDASNLRYHDGLLRASGIDRDKYPDIVPCTEVIGELTQEVCAALGLPRPVPVVAGSIDNTAAAVGSGAVRDFEPHLYIGTSSWLTAHVPFKKTDIFTEMASVPCAVPGRYLFMAMQTTAGGNLTFLRDKILYHKDELLQEAEAPDVYKILDRIAESTPPGSNGVIYTPWIYGERSPIKDSHIRAAIHNLSLENSRADIIRAFLEGVAYNTRWLLGPFEKNLKRPSGAIRFAGGGAASGIWCRILADVLDRPIQQCADPIQVNARGAAYIAGVGLGELQFDDVPGLVQYQQTYEPDPANRALYDDRFGIFTQLYEANKKIYRKLNPHAD